MDFQSKDLETLLQRTNLQIPFADFLKHVEQVYSIGKIVEFSPIAKGYEEANVKITTSSGNYFIKIFSKDRTKDLVKSYVNVLKKAEENNIMLIRLVEGKQGHFATLQEETIPVFYYLTYAFEGKDFSTSKPSLEDMIAVTEQIAKLNTLNFPILPGYDSWGSKNLIYEYGQTKDKIPQEIKDMILPTVEEMMQLDDSKFGQSIIHGDIQRKHVLKNEKGDYCLLDLSCMRNDAKVYDLSTHLAWFCLAEDTWGDKEKIVDEVIRKYAKDHILSKDELASIPLLVKASYASFIRVTSFFIAAGDTSEETREWFEKSKEMFALISEWDWKM